MKPKNLTLRAFRIENNDPTRTENGLLNILSDKLDNTTVQDRRMLLNENDPHREEDLISNFNIRRNEGMLFASILRIAQGNDTVSIPNDMFSESKFSLSELGTIANIPALYKDIQYILVSRDIVIVCWMGNKSIKSVQAYLNWFLVNERGQFIFELTPMVKPTRIPAIKDLKEIILAESFTSVQSTNNRGGNSFSNLILNLKKLSFNQLFNDMPTLDEEVLNNMVSAKLLIKLQKKPKEMSQEDYDRIFGAYMKPMADLEDVKYVTKSGNTVKASEILHTKKVSVDLASNNQISEQSLYLEMERFLQEITSEE